MTSEKLQEWISIVWGRNDDNVRRLLVPDQAPIHRTQAAKNAFEEHDTDVLYVPAGAPASCSRLTYTGISRLGPPWDICGRKTCAQGREDTKGKLEEAIVPAGARFCCRGVGHCTRRNSGTLLQGVRRCKCTCKVVGGTYGTAKWSEKCMARNGRLPQ